MYESQTTEIIVFQFVVFVWLMGHPGLKLKYNSNSIPLSRTLALTGRGRGEIHRKAWPKTLIKFNASHYKQSAVLKLKR